MALAGLMFVAGCATSNDPSEGGFINGVVGLATGRYEKRVEEKQALLDQKQQENKEIKQEVAVLEREKVEVDNDLATSKARLAELQREMVELRQRLEHATFEEGRERQRYLYLKQELDALEQEMSQVSELNGQSKDEMNEQIRNMEERKQKLEKALNEAINSY